MAELVVNQLQVIDIEHQDRERLLEPLGGLQLFLHPLVEEAAVLEFGQLVAAGHLLHLGPARLPDGLDALALAVDPCLDESEHGLDGDGKTNDSADAQRRCQWIALELEVRRHNAGDRRCGDDEDEYPEEDERAMAPLVQLIARFANDICH